MGRLDDAEATNCTGEPVVDPGAGELTETPANADALKQHNATTEISQYFPGF
jgi:hypothetical protein